MSTQIDFTGSLNDEETRVALNLPRKILTTSTGRSLTSGITVVREAESCSYNALLDLDRKRLLHQASLVLLPSTYGEGRLFSQKPAYNSNGTFTAIRATTATRVNSAGLVDLVPYNLLQYSEQFNQNIWTVNSIGIDINNTTAPDGTLTAEKIRVLSGQPVGSSHIQQIVNKAAGILQFSCSSYLKAAELNSGRLFVRDGISAANNANVQFNLNTGVISLAATANGTFSSASATITSVGNGWYRCTLSFTSSSDTVLQFRIGTADTTIITGNGTDGIFLWGAQLVEGTDALPYLRTETRLNIPRVDYSLSGCPNILLEPQRTNLALQSSSFDSVSWSKTASSVTANSTTSPSGVVDADTLTADGTSSRHDTFFAPSVTSGTNYTYSVYAKKGTNDFLQLSTGGGFGSNAFANFDLNTGVIGTIGSAATATITALGNGWYRCTMTAPATITGGTGIYNLIVTSSTAARLETNTLTTSVFLWGAQFEAGAYATSYIPTTTASVTRNADFITRYNIFTNGLITAAGGTWFVELRNNLTLIRDSIGGIWIGDNATAGTLGNTLVIRHGGASQRLSIGKTISGSFIFLFTTTTDTVKLAIKWNGTSADIFENGVKVVSATSFTPTAMENLICNAGATPYNINSMALYPTPLSDTELISLTTL